MFLVVSRSDVHFGFDQPFLGEKNYFGKNRAPKKKLAHPCWGQELGNSVLDISKNLLTENLYENKNGLEWWQLFESSIKAINLNYWHLLTDVMILRMWLSNIVAWKWFPNLTDFQNMVFVLDLRKINSSICFLCRRYVTFQ